MEITVIGLLQLIVLVLLVWPLLHLCINRTFSKAFPRLATAMVVAIFVYTSILLAFALYAPILVAVASVIAVIAITVERWRALPSYGRNKGLPPGSLTLLPIGPLVDDGYLQKQAQRYGPVFKISHFFKPEICVLGFERGFELLSQHGKQMGSPVDPFSRFIPKGYIRYMQPENHQCYRAILQSAFSKNVMLACNTFVHQRVAYVLREMSVACMRPDVRGVDPKEYLNKLMFDTNLKMFFGIEPDTELSVRMADLYPVIDNARRRPMTVMRKKSDQDVLVAIGAITTVIEHQVSSFTQNLDNNQQLPVCVLSEIVRTHPGFAKDPTVLGNLIFMARVAGEDMVGLLMWVLKMLSDHPVWIGRIKDEQAGNKSISAQEHKLAYCFVLETLRLRQSEYIYRFAKQDIHFENYLIPKGWMIRICVRETHRLDTIFADPEKFEPQRMRDHKFSRSEYAPFGLAQHNCIGQNIAKTLAEIFAVELVVGFDWSTVSDGPVEYRGWHWAPSSNFKIYITSND